MYVRTYNIGILSYKINKAIEVIEIAIGQHLIVSAIVVGSIPTKDNE